MKRRSFQTIHYLLVLLIGIGATVLESQGQWKKMPTETNNTLWSLDFTDTSRGWAIGSYGKILTTQQGGAHGAIAVRGINGSCSISKH